MLSDQDLSDIRKRAEFPPGMPGSQPLADDVLALLAEVDRLRAALQYTIDNGDLCSTCFNGPSCYCTDCQCAPCFARAALETR